ncbi:MAG: 2,3-butanediol dehydrogenase [Acidimicrobiia bacterium]|nr:MAG: 2,3-butanediol dehydrogenase [Acidimicrobiia bacterium]
MKALRWHGHLDLRIDDVPVPTIIDPDDVIIAVEACGICGSDVEEVRHGPIVIPTDEPHPLTATVAPVTLGHEIVGRVIAAGEQSGIDVGTRVAPLPLIWCGECTACLAGAIGRCEKVAVLGLARDGGLGELVRVRGQHCVTVPEDMPPRVAATVEPYSVAIHALSGIDVEGLPIAVVGFGSVGACVADVAIANGAGSVVAIDPDAGVRNRAVHGGAELAVHPDETGGIEAPLVVEASGALRGLATAAEVVTSGGTIILVGIRGGEVPVESSKLVFGEVTVVGRVGHDLTTMRASVAGLSNGSIGSRFADAEVVDLAFARRYLLGDTEFQSGRKIIVRPYLDESVSSKQ